MKHCGQNGELVGESWWGGILLGFQNVEGEKYTEKAPLRHMTKREEHAISKTVLIVPAQAHLWDSCIRNPRKLKSKSSDINTHTNVAFARKAGLKERTLNGMCVLAFALPLVIAASVGNNSGVQLQRVACLFSAPVLLAFDPIALEVRLLGINQVSGGSSADYNTIVAAFEVVTPEGKTAIRNGYVEILLAKPTFSQRGSASKL
jgi:hypothetical protein